MNSSNKKDFDWVTIKVKEDLVWEIDKVIEATKKFGVPRYRSRSDFVKFATLALLEREHRRTAAAKNEAEGGGEEILVTRK